MLTSESAKRSSPPLGKPNQRDSAEPRNILPDCIIPALAVCFTVYYLTTITEVPWISQASAIVVSMLLLASIVAFAFRSYRRIKRGEEKLAVTSELLLTDRATNVKRILLLGLAVAYVWLIESWGFTLTTFCFIFLGIVLLSSLSNWKNALLIALACSVIGYLVFIRFFKTRFPAGLIEDWLKTVFG